VTVAIASRRESDLGINAELWIRHLRAANLSPATVSSYSQSVARLESFLAEGGMPRSVAGIRREHVEAFVEDVLARQSPATAAARFAGLVPFFRWLVDEGEISESPMVRMRRPKVPETPRRVVAIEDLRELVMSTKGAAFEDRRDQALIRAFVASGVRLSELAGVQVGDVDVARGHMFVMGKGRWPRTVDLGEAASLAMRRYLRARAAHPKAGQPWLWIGPKGRLTASGIGQLVRRRAEAAGIGRVHPHLFRHAWAHAGLAGGISEGDMMTLGGWRSRSMLDRYGAAARTERALAAARRFNPGDQV
jgi:site-specific recombinase XerD